MKLALSFLMVCLCVSANAEAVKDAAKPAEVPSPELAPSRPRIMSPPPTLGLSLQKPDPTVTAQLADLPTGIGFLVVAVDEAGPAARAGVQVHDVIWKLGDQMLVNEAQMHALLRLHKPGDMLAFSGFRSGKPQMFKVQIGHPKPRLTEVLTIAGPSSGALERGITQVVNSSEKFAKTTSADGVAELVKDADGYRVSIKDSKHAQIFNEAFPAGGSFEGVPAAWKYRVMALKRALDQSISGELSALRQPRPRVVPPPMVPKQSVAP